MIRILQTKPWSMLDLAQWFDLNGQPYEFVNSGHYDFVTPWTDMPGNKLIFLLSHNYDNQVNDVENHLQDNSVIIITNAVKNGYSHPRVVTNDFLFNLTRAYYSKFKFSTDNLIWHAGAECYTLPKISANQRSKIFITTGRGRPSFNKRKYRSKIVEYLDQFDSVGFVGDPWLPSNKNIATPYPGHVNEPVNDYYYLESFISIYGETVEYGHTIVVTEKTYNPLIKGHFILPFSSAGIIQHIIKMGFKMPKFIDYTYDSVIDDECRFNRYCDEIKRLLNIPLPKWQQHWNDNLDIIQHNRNWFWQRGFDRVDLTSYIDIVDK